MVQDNTKMIRNQIAVGEEVLRIVQGIDWSSRIIGGAPRDWGLNTICNDIDIYTRSFMSTRAGYKMYARTLEKLLGLEEGGVLIKGRELSEVDIKTGTYQTLEGLNCVLEFNYKGQEFDLMLMDYKTSIGSLKNSMDCTLCQVCFGGIKSTSVRLSEKQDLIDNNINVFNDGIAEDAPHTIKILNLFPDFTHILEGRVIRRKGGKS